MPSCVSHKIKKKKKKAVVKPLQINIRYALKSSECACVYFVVLSGNGLGIWLGARLPAWARALSWTGARLSGPEAKPSHQHSIGSNLVHVASLLVSSELWTKGQAASIRTKVSAARGSATLRPFPSCDLSQHEQFSPGPQQVGPAVPLQTWPSLLAPFRN